MHGGRKTHAELWQRLGDLPLDRALVWPATRDATYYANLYNRSNIGFRVRCKFHSIDRDGKPHVLAVRYE